MSTSTLAPTRLPSLSHNGATASRVVIAEGLVQDQGVVISCRAILSRIEYQPGSMRPCQAAKVTKEVKLRAPDSGQYVLQETNHHLTVSLRKRGETKGTIVYEADNTTLTLPATSARAAQALSNRYGYELIEGSNAIGIRSPCMIQVINADGATTVYHRGTRTGSYQWNPASDQFTGVEHPQTDGDPVHVAGTLSPDGQAWLFPDQYSGQTLGAAPAVLQIDPFIPRLAKV